MNTYLCRQHYFSSIDHTSPQHVILGGLEFRY